MFGTVIIDAYRKEETLEMADAIDDLCSPTDNYGWASAGIYCFWDYYAEAVLYIGLAGDLAERFKQHNGILPIKEGSKQKQIEDYFSRNERLGYTIFVQSPLSQPLVHRNRKVYEKFAKQQNSPIEDMLSEQGRDDIKRVEGILIESFRRKYGHFPLWNSMGGSMVGQTKVMENNINIVNSFCQPDNYAINPIVVQEKMYMDVDDVCAILGVSKAYAYNLMREYNKELKAKGYIVVAGKISTKFLAEKIYGMKVED